MNLVGPFQLKIFYDSSKEYFSLLNFLKQNLLFRQASLPTNFVSNHFVLGCSLQLKMLNSIRLTPHPSQWPTRSLSPVMILHNQCMWSANLLPLWSAYLWVTSLPPQAPPQTAVTQRLQCNLVSLLRCNPTEQRYLVPLTNSILPTNEKDESVELLLLVLQMHAEMHTYLQGIASQREDLLPQGGPGLGSPWKG